ETGDEVTYQLVGPDESEPENGMISITSPIGRALIGKQIGDDVVVQAPGGVREFVVLDMSSRSAHPSSLELSFSKS
ncbi:MAG: GreA/GreB family elongation factor, partial [Verrucomicrobiota bacterium]